MRHVAAVLFVAMSCSKPQPKPDSIATAAPATKLAAAPASPLPRTDSATLQSTKSPPRAPGTSTVSSTSATRKNLSVGDVIIGRVNEHGFDPVTFLAITPASGAQVRVSGSQIAALGAVKGADVWAQGRQDADGFVVDTFEVRKVDDRPVEDGIVSVSGTTVTVRTARATLTYPDAPTALRDAAGARVWISAPVAGQAPSFGVIRAPAAKQFRR